MSDFFQQISNPGVFVDLFETLPGIYLFIKDHEHRFVRANRALAHLHGCATESEMIGRSDFDFNPPALAAQYVEEDLTVMRSNKALIDQVWLVQGANPRPSWYLSSKFPLRNQSGEVIGIAGVMRPYEQFGDSPAAFHRLTAACEYVLTNFGRPIVMAELAAQAHLSVSQLQREFRRLFAMSPSEYLLRVRLLMARRKLEQTNLSIGQLALECGFYDQSHFTRAFRSSTGLSPLAYRRRFLPAYQKSPGESF